MLVHRLRTTLALVALVLSMTDASSGVAHACECRAGIDNFCLYGANAAGCAMTAPGGYCDPNGDGSFADADWPRGWIELHDACVTNPPPADGCDCRAGVDNLCSYGPNAPGCSMTAPGGYCDPNGDGSFSDGDWPRGWFEYRAACIEPPGECACRDDVDNFCLYEPAAPGCAMTFRGGYCDPNADGSLDDADWVRGWTDYRNGCVAPPEPTPTVTPTPQPGSRSDFTWTVIDDCVDGFGLEVRFFDFANRTVWPESFFPFFTLANSDLQETLRCFTGSDVCLGARPRSTFSGVSWGVGVDGDRSCDDCCAACTPGGSRTVHLSCANRLTSATARGALRSAAWSRVADRGGVVYRVPVPDPR